jgi:Trk-type K+ transport system membrane component
VSAYTGGGLSLVDQGMVPFISAYPLVISLGFLIVAGNMLMVRLSRSTGLTLLNLSTSLFQPVFLRGIVWGISKLLPVNTHRRTYWDFLLAHPRRCFLYLFPAHQTYFLIVVFFFLTYFPNYSLASRIS